MDKEKQAFEDWYNADDTEIENTIGREIVKGTKFSVITGIVFYGGYHSRDEEIAALRAEIKELKIEIEVRKKDFLVARRESAERLNEIERKDEAIKNFLELLDMEMEKNIEPFAHGYLTSIRCVLEEALQNKE